MAVGGFDVDVGGFGVDVGSNGVLVGRVVGGISLTCVPQLVMKILMRTANADNVGRIGSPSETCKLITQNPVRSGTMTDGISSSLDASLLRTSHNTAILNFFL